MKQLTEEKILPLPEIIFHFAVKKIIITLVFVAGKMEKNSFLFWPFDQASLFLCHEQMVSFE